MKTKLLMAALALFMGLVSQGCTDDDEKVIVPETVQSVFESKFPTAQYVKWERKGNLYEAEFIVERDKYEAWFQNDGTWVRTEKDINLLTTALPQPVQNYLDTNYSGWKVDDADLVLTPTDEYYELDIEKRGENDVCLWIRPDGTLLNRL